MLQLTRRQLGLALLWSLLVAAAATAPYVWAGLWTPAGQVFSGHITAVDESNVYLQWIRQAHDGRVLLINQYTTRPQTGLFLNVFLLALGRLAAWTGMEPAGVWLLARFVCGVYCVLMCFLLACALSRDGLVRWGTLVLASLSSGWGWWVDQMSAHQGLVLGNTLVQPVDYGPFWVYQPEAITFLAVLVNPLFSFSIGLLCTAVTCAVLALDTGRWAVALVGALAVLLLGNVHTYDMLVLAPLIVALHLGWAAAGAAPWRRAIGGLLLFGLCSLPGPLWAVHTLQGDPAYRLKALTATPAGPPLNYVFGYGFVTVLAVVGTYVLVANRGRARHREVVALVWVVLGSAVLYLCRVSIQRKLVEGLHVPLCLLAALALARLPRRWAGFGIAAAGLLAAPSNLYFVADCVYNVRTNNAALAGALMPPIYITTGEDRAMRWAHGALSEDDVVLSVSTTGSYIPTRARCKVVAGHWAETLDFSMIVSDIVAPFFLPWQPEGTGAAPNLRREALKRSGATYVFFGPQEAAFERAMLADAEAKGMPLPMPPGWQPGADLARLPYLKRVYSAEGVAVYRVVRDAL